MNKHSLRGKRQHCNKRDKQSAKQEYKQRHNLERMEKREQETIKRR